MQRERLYVYLALTGAMLLFLLFCAREPVERGNAGLLALPFRKAAARLLRSKHLRRFLPGQFRRQERIWQQLRLLDPSSGRREAENLCIEQLANALLVLFLADLLAIFVFVGTERSAELSGREIARNGYGGDTKQVTLQAGPSEETFDLAVYARRYTKEQANALEQELAPKLRNLILGDNPDLLHVRNNLNLVRKVEGYPFRISWSATSYAHLDTDGTVNAEDISLGGSESLVLTATLSLDGTHWEERFPVVLLPQELDEKQAFQKSVEQAAKEAEEESRSGEKVVLPEQAEGTPLSWQQVLSDDSLPVFLLGAAAAVLVCAGGYRDLAKKVKRREQELARDYPQLVTKLVLFLGTGMAMRNVFRRIGDDYLAKRKKGGEKQYVYEEILVLCHELENGVPEGAAYSKFGSRCGLRCYTRLCSLLVQNLRKGNAELLQRLQEEADSAMEQRKDAARKLGEEAGTKLLVPMILMLVVVMVMITVPAYLGFAF
ncbi:MAG: hypothetical protein ACI4OJ_05415 [Lachnospiraceae bacterium]